MAAQRPRTTQAPHDSMAKTCADQSGAS